MASVVGICNAALVAIGAQRIISLDEQTKTAQLCNDRYESVRDAVLRAHPWNCAMSRASLAQMVDAPAFGYDYQFQLPDDFLYVVDAFGDDESEITDWQVEGRKLLSNEDIVYIKYVQQVTDPNQFDSLCREAVAARLAAELAFPIAGSKTLEQEKWQLYLEKLREARGVDAQEGTPVDESTDSWITARG